MFRVKPKGEKSNKQTNKKKYLNYERKEKIASRFNLDL